MRRVRLALAPFVLILGFAFAAAAAAEARAIEATPPPPDAAWLARAQQGLAEREYRASESGAGLQAPNRAHNLRTYFEKAGIRVHDRTAGGSPELLRLALARVGRGEKLAAVAPGEAVEAAESRVEIRRPGLVEWYVNSAAGLEQGFTLAERPAGEGALVVELAVAGATARLRGDAVVFETGTGRKLRYAELVAADADGRALAARLELPTPERLRIVVEDAGAVYPLVIDPLLTETADTQLESNQAEANFGWSVAGAGDVNGDGYADVIIGAWLYDSGQSEEGAAFVFLGSASGIVDGNPSTAAAQLESNQANANLGMSVAGAGDVNGDGYADVIVGAFNYDAGQGYGEGAAFVFLGSGSGIADGNPSTAAAQLESNQDAAFLGRGVSGAGDVNGDGYADVIVGAPRYDNGQTDEGAAFVFLGSAAGIADGNPASAATQLESDQASTEFGFVAGAGDVNGDGYADVIVGAPFYDAGQTDEGAAFVFHGSATGIADGSPSSAAAQLESDQAAAYFGQTLAGAGDVNGDGYADVVVDASWYDAGQLDEGAAFVFLGSASGIADADPATAAAQLESNQADAHLGGVAGAGDVNGDGYADVIVTAWSYDAGQSDEGAAFVFLGSATGIADGSPTSAAAQLEADQANAVVGTAAGAGDVNGDGYADVIVGALRYDAGQSDEGAAFVYLGGATGIVDGGPTSAAAQLESNQVGGDLGFSVAGAGDVNGDGYTDVIVGAYWYDAGQTDEGAAFVFLGGASGIADASPATAAAQLESNQAVGQLGYSVAGAGDVNADGYADVIVGAFSYDDGESNEGAAFVFHGSATGVVASGNPGNANATLEPNQASAGLGESVAGAGDVNGDGYADVIVGAILYDAGQTNEGAAFVFHGSATGVVASGNPGNANATFESNLTSAGLGESVAGAGDVNGDGYADVIVGAVLYDAGQTDEGAAFVFHGSASGLVASGNPGNAVAQLEADQAVALLGESVAAAGDVNGDGYADVIVGAPNYDAGQTDEGAAFVFLGSATGIADGTPATAMSQLESNQASAGLGYRVAGAGDVNGDGTADVIVGAPFYDSGQTDEGAAFVFLGSAAGIADGNPTTTAARLETNQASAQLWGVAGVGDVNGDGYADVVVGSRAYDAGQTDEGAAFVFLGNGDGDGRPVLARQLRSSVDTPIQPWGRTHSKSPFRVRMQATHPEGRGRVKLRIEYCPPGVAFGHASCGSKLGASWTDVTATSGGVTLTEGVAGLVNNRNYRWRARVQYAPFRVTQAGITAPPKPAHGPWRRLQAQAVEADLRTKTNNTCGLGFELAPLLLILAARRRSGRRNSRHPEERR